MPVTPSHLVSQLQTVERVGGVWVEGLREEAQGEGEVASQVCVPVQTVLQGFVEDGVEHQGGQQLPGSLASSQLGGGGGGGMDINREKIKCGPLLFISICCLKHDGQPIATIRSLCSGTYSNQ